MLIVKAKMEAYDKIKMVPKGDRLVAYGVTNRWFADVSGPCFADQDMIFLHSDPLKNEDLAEHVEMWQEAEGARRRIQLGPFFEINALRMLMTGKVKE